VIEIEFAAGVRMRITGAVDTAVLRAGRGSIDRWTGAMIQMPTGVRVWLATARYAQGVPLVDLADPGDFAS
jgi:hypothetical protein